MELDFSKERQEFLQIDKASLKTWELNVFEFLDTWFSRKERVLVKTSGSTGVPKILQVDKIKMQNSAQMTCDFLGLKKGDLALLCLPIEYISGKMMMVRAVERQMRIVLKEPNLSPLQDLETEINFCAMTPLQVEKSLDKIHLIRKLIIGGAEVSGSLKKKIIGNKNLTNNNQIYETYGMTETLSHIALKQIFPNEEECFKALKGVEISQDERGCLVVFASKITEDKLVTNDLVELKNGGEFKFLGRQDNVINSGGVKVSPEILENFVKKFIPNELVFVGIPDEILGQKLILVIEGDYDERLKIKVLNLNFERRFYRPKEIVFIENFPRTPNGKVSRLGILEFLKTTF